MLNCAYKTSIFHLNTEFLHTVRLLLPPANEVWGKVIFSQACVKNSVHREGCLLPGGGGCLLRGVPGGDLPGTTTAAGGTHPTGMHSCSSNVIL